MNAFPVGLIAVVLLAGAAAAQPPATRADPGGLTITAVGDRLIITGDDPKQVALAHELARHIISNQGQVYKVFRLQNSNAVEVARVLNEWFNGTRPQTQSEPLNPFAAFGPGGGSIGGRASEPAPGKPRVRIVAEQTSNSLLVRANALDLITIQSLLDSVLDAGAGDSKAVMKPFFIGPLQYAVATEVVAILKDVYRESTNQAANLGGGGLGGGFGGPFGGPGVAGFGGGGRQPLDALGRPRQVTLTITADDRSNSVIGMATELMAKDVRAVVAVMEGRARDARKVVQLVPTAGVDPAVVRDVFEAIQGRAHTRADAGGPPGWTSPMPFTGGGPFGSPGSGFGGGFSGPAGPSGPPGGLPGGRGPGSPGGGGGRAGGSRGGRG